MSILEQLSELVYSKLTTDLAEYLADDLGLNSHTVAESIKGYLSQMSTSSQKPLIFKEAEKTTIQVVSGSSTANGSATSPIVNGTNCTYLIQRGENRGKVCNAKIRGGGVLCSKHRK